LGLGANPVCHAIAIDGDAPRVTGNQIFDFRGSAILVRNSTTAASAQRRIGLVDGNFISHCWTAIENHTADLHVCNNSVANCRDVGLDDVVGATQSSGNHFFGMQTGIDFRGGQSFSTNDRFSDCGYGFRIRGTASNSAITGGKSEHCWYKNIWAEKSVHLHNVIVEVANSSDEYPGIIGIHLQGGGGSSISGGHVVMGDFTFPDNTELDLLAFGSTHINVTSRLKSRALPPSRMRPASRWPMQVYSPARL
jgi:hypothetical protein